MTLNGQRPRLRFLLLLALCMVGLRILIFDHVFFAPEAPPNHDMGAGLAFFTTSMHSVRLTGDLAWWSPVGGNGSAQYYQAFFSPLAPTPSHLVFILWVQMIRLLALCGIAIPEYYQYLVVNYVLLPYLAVLAFSLFASFLFRQRTTLALVTLVWMLSGIGLWQSAWFYFQEPVSLFFFLAACLAALRRPTVPRMLLLVVAALLQAVSVNYWTLYNSFFVLIVLGAYARVHPHQVRRLWRRARQAIAGRPRTSLALGCGVGAVLCLWAVLLASVLREQTPNYVRSVGTFSIQDAHERVQEMRRYTLELFNPEVYRPLRTYPILNEIHNARYIGCTLIPLLLVFPLQRWGRRERWLLLAALGVLVVCLAPPWLLQAWKAIPQMDRIRHLFYFYTQYWQILVLFLAGASLDSLTRSLHNPAIRRRLTWALGGLCAVLTLLLLGLGTVTHLFERNDIHLQGNLTLAVLTLGTAGVLLRATWDSGRHGLALFQTVLLVLTVTDLSKYFWQVNRFDRLMTFQRSKMYETYPKEVRALLQRPWPVPDATRGWDGGIPEQLPIHTEFWPENTFLIPRVDLHLAVVPPLRCRALNGAPVSFCPEARYLPTAEDILRAGSADPSLYFTDRILPIQAPVEAVPNGGSPGGAFRSRFLSVGYNSVVLEVETPQSGWLALRRLHDPLWEATVAGQRVKCVPALFSGTGLPVGGGKQEIRLEYRPLARRLYGIACLSLEFVLGVLLIATWRSRSVRAVQRSSQASSEDQIRRAA